MSRVKPKDSCFKVTLRNLITYILCETKSQCHLNVALHNLRTAVPSDVTHVLYLRHATLFLHNQRAYCKPKHLGPNPRTPLASTT